MQVSDPQTDQPSESRLMVSQPGWMSSAGRVELMDMSWLRQPQISIHNDVCIQVQHPRCLLALLAFFGKAVVL